MAEFPGLDGSHIYIKDKSVRRFRPLDPNDPGKGTKLYFAGESLPISLSVEETLDTLSNAADFVRFETRAGMRIWLNKNTVISVRPSVPSHGEGTEINPGGFYQHVVEPYDEVKTLLGL